MWKIINQKVLVTERGMKPMSEIDNLASALSILTIWSELWALYKALIYMFCIYQVSLFPTFALLL